MKTLIFLFCLISTIAVAQNAARVVRMPVPSQNEAGEALSGNYLIKLMVSDKDKPITEINLVTATTRFRADVADPMMSLIGTVSLQESGTMLVCYSLNTQLAVPTQTMTVPPASSQTATTISSIEYKSSSVQASVLLGMGEAVQILKTGSRTYELSIVRLAETPKKEK